MSDWHVGQKVVCIGHFSTKHGEIVPVDGQIYTLREIRDEGNLFFMLDEIRNPLRRYIEGVRELAFHSIGFRPVVEPHADISAFQAILDRVNKREVVDA